MSATDAARELRKVWHALEDQLLRAVEEESERAVEGMRLHFLPFTDNKNSSSRFLQSRSGDLKDSLRAVSRATEDGITATFFLDSASEDTNIAAWVNEFGSDYGNPVEPRVSEKMHIPVGDALDSRGVRRFRRVRDAYDEYFLVFLDDVILGRPWGSDEPLEVMWLRRDHVDIRARPFARPEIVAMISHLERRVDRLMSKVAH